MEQKPQPLEPKLGVTSGPEDQKVPVIDDLDDDQLAFICGGDDDDD